MKPIRRGKNVGASGADGGGMQLQDFMYIQYMHFMQFASSGFSTLPNTTVESSLAYFLVLL